MIASVWITFSRTEQVALPLAGEAGQPERVAGGQNMYRRHPVCIHWECDPFGFPMTERTAALPTRRTRRPPSEDHLSIR